MKIGGINFGGKTETEDGKEDVEKEIHLVVD